MVSALNVGNNILDRAFSENIDITPMKLQKIIYFVYRDYLQKSGAPLFSERFETWKYGPVIPSVYQTFKKYRANAIKQYALENDGNTALMVNEDASPVFKDVLGHVWNCCKTFNGIYLSSITHKEGSAWRKAFERKDPYLSDDDIKVEYLAYE